MTEQADSSFGMGDLRRAYELATADFGGPMKVLIGEPWGPLERVPSGRRWWQFWRPRWIWRHAEPDHVLLLGQGTVICTARQKAELDRRLGETVLETGRWFPMWGNL